MSSISEETINNVRSSLDIVDVIGSYISLSQKGKNYFGICPFHDDHSPSMSVSQEKQIYTCFSCGATGNIFTFVMNYEHVSFIEALKILSDKAGIKLNIETTTNTINDKYKKFYEVYDIITNLYKNNLSSKEGEEAREYLKKRQIDNKIINEFSIGLSLKNNVCASLSKKYGEEVLTSIGLGNIGNDKIYDIFQNRIMFPIKDIYGHIVAFSGRIYMSSDDAKYINTKESMIFKKGSLFYNYSDALEYIKQKKEIIICEGQMDAIRISSIGLKNVVALMGTALTTDHINLIKKTSAKVVLCFDNDDAGNRATSVNGQALKNAGLEVEVLVFSPQKDADDYIIANGKDAFLNNYKNLRSYIDFQLYYLKKSKNLDDSVELSKYLNEAIDEIKNISDDILREIKINELCKEFNINEEVIKSKFKTNNNINIIKKENKKIVKQKYDKYLLSEMRIIFLMLNNEEVRRIFERDIGVLPTERFRELSNSIIYFKDKNNGFDYADFLTYILDKPQNETLKEVMSVKQNIEYEESELEEYIDNIKIYRVRNEIDNLKSKMNRSLDIEEKKRIAKRIENMKKEVLKW
ncbi:MAG: DNA primase [Bacilli bacterium]